MFLAKHSSAYEAMASHGIYIYIYMSYCIQVTGFGPACNETICYAKVAMSVVVYMSILSAMTLTCGHTYFLGDKEHGHEIQESGSEPSVQFG